MLSIWLACIEGDSVKADEEPNFKITTKRGNDRVGVKVDQDGACFTIRSPMGISSATIQRIDSTWPARMKLRLYLRGLESLKVGNGTATVSAAVASHVSSAGIRVWLNDHEEKTLLENERFFMTIHKHQIPVETKEPVVSYFEVDLPAALFEANPATIHVDWIDFYR
jgi:hypothetical protein